MGMVYNKAVRDRIPEIILRTGKTPEFEQLSDHMFLVELEKKLLEEVNEYLVSRSVEELVDVQEILYRIMELKRMSWSGFESLVEKKRLERGGFQKNMFLKHVT